MQHAGKRNCQRPFRCCCYAGNSFMPNLSNNLLIAVCKANSDGDNISNQIQLYTLKPTCNRLHIKPIECRAVLWANYESRQYMPQGLLSRTERNSSCASRNELNSFALRETMPCSVATQ